MQFYRAVLLSLALVVPAPLMAQEAPGSDPVFTETLEVRVVNLEVVVEDRQGNRVPGLEPEDFELLVDGAVLPIDYFTEIQGGQVVARDRESGAGVEAVNGVSPGEPLGTSYLVFIDDFFTVGNLRNRAIEGVREAIPLLGANDRMAVVAFDGQRLAMLSPWSGSREDLLAVLDDAKGRRAWGRRTQVLLQRGMPSSLAVQAYEQRLRDMTVAIRSTMRSFAQPPGRKVMLLVAGEWPNSPALYLDGGNPFGDDPGTAGGDGVGGSEDPLPVDAQRESDLRRSHRIFEPIYQTANRLGYTLYPIDSGGVSGGGFNQTNPDIYGALEPPPADPQLTLRDPDEPRISQTRFDMGNAAPSRPIASLAAEQEIHIALEVLAHETGGKALIDSARNDSLERIVADTRSYYWFGFTPEWHGDDQVHTVEVKALGKGLRVRSRGSYQDLSRSKEVTYMVESAMLFEDVPWAEPLTVEMGKPHHQKGKRLLPLKLFIPMDKVTALPHEDRYRIPLELRLMAMDAKGHRSEVDLIPLELVGSAQPQPGQVGVQTVDVRLRKGTHDLVVSLHDALGGKIFTARLEVDP